MTTESRSYHWRHDKTPTSECSTEVPVAHEKSQLLKRYHWTAGSPSNQRCWTHLLGTSDIWGNKTRYLCRSQCYRCYPEQPEPVSGCNPVASGLFRNWECDLQNTYDKSLIESCDGIICSSVNHRLGHRSRRCSWSFCRYTSHSWMRQNEVDIDKATYTIWLWSHIFRMRLTNVRV